MADDGQISQRTEDAIVNLIATRLTEKDLYRLTMDSMSPADRQLVEDALDRHAERQRKAGKPGW